MTLSIAWERILDFRFAQNDKWYTVTLSIAWERILGFRFAQNDNGERYSHSPSNILPMPLANYL
ncbi:MAG: hypothetical protein AUK32_03300 [Candidatus Aquicultor secundus]|nr:MAG: hypothetical protein AUK32_03300 [Candidatus Aquicultor secundus]